MHGYQRVGEAITHIGIYLGGVIVMHYVDDYWVLDIEENAWSGYRTFKALTHLVGFKLEPSKTTKPSHQIELLGLHLTLAQRPHEPYFVKVTSDRKEKLRAAIAEVLDREALSPGEAGKLAGRLGFAAGGLFGRVGQIGRAHV